MNGDGYSSVIACENVEDTDGFESDAGPVYCDFSVLVAQLEDALDNGAVNAANTHDVEEPEDFSLGHIISSSDSVLLAVGALISDREALVRATRVLEEAGCVDVATALVNLVHEKVVYDTVQMYV